MSKLAEKMRHRTGQAPGLMVPAGLGNGGNGGGGCGPVAPAAPMSWGAACPSGACTSESLAASLNRSFAGDRYGCRELPYWVTGTADGAGQVVIAQNSLVTICPTRIIFEIGAGAAVPAGAAMSVFEIQNQNQIVGDPLPLRVIFTDAYQTIPFVTDCMKAGIPFRIVLTGLTPASLAYVGLIGPAIG